MSADDTAAADAAAAEKPPGVYAWYVAVVLVLAYALSFLDRKLPFILVESIKHDLSLSDTQIGLLTGVMFALVYSTVAIPIATLADRGSRKKLIAGAVFIWSSVTALGGFAQNFWHLAASRVGVAAGEAALSPAAHSMLADYFKPRFRARALGFYFVGAQIGIVGGLALGGWINEIANWRVAMFLCGVPGVILALLIFFTVREPARTRSAPVEGDDGVRPARLMETLRALFKHPTFIHLMIAALLSSFTSGAVNAFTPSYIIRTFGLTSAEVGFSYGFVTGGAGAVGAVLGGFLGDRLRKSHPRRALQFVALATAIGAPCLAYAFVTQTYWVFLTMLFIAQVGVMTYAGPSFATIQSLVGPRMHAVASAVYLFAHSGLGLALGPLAVGMMSDWLIARGSENSLRIALFIVVLPKLWSSLHYYLAARSLGRVRGAAAAPV
ncbi:MAG: hypothetical protein ABS78_06695 [Phenylobacterium sp. SCN 70-31]|nr:MAG: hypothetical protein ABS78_06695 [Phenylobacterium sp. SCN 70-31]